MGMANVLLAESGSTKTDWCLVKKNGRPARFRTSGINPYLQSPELIETLLREELNWNRKKYEVEAISFYGAGTGSPTNQKMLSAILRRFFEVKKIEVQTDMMAAARALCGDQSGIVCILGTGSNSCFYNGKGIKEQTASL